VTGQTAASISLGCWALASQRNLANRRGYVAVWQICTAIQVFRVIAAVTALAEHRRPHLQQRRNIGAVRRVAIGAVVHNGRMLPKEGPALLRVARVTRLVDRFLDEELGAVGAVHVVTTGTRYFSFENRVPREAMNLGVLGLVALSADLGLGHRVQHFLLYRVRFVTIGAGNSVHFVLAARPVRPSTDA